MDKSSGNCEELGAVVNMRTYGSRFGIWEGFNGFKYEDAKYIFTFQGFDGLLYNSYIRSIFDTVDKIGAKAATEPFHINTIRWVTYEETQVTIVDGKESIAKFEFAGEAAAVFDRLYNDHAFFRSCSSSCNYAVGNSQELYKCQGDLSPFDKVSNKFSIKFDDVNENNTISTDQYSAECQSVIPDAEFFGFNGQYSSTLNVKLDAESLMLATSLNLGIMNGTHLESTGVVFLLPKVSAPATVIGTAYSHLSVRRRLVGYTNPSKKGMDPIWCNYNVNTGQVYTTGDAPYCYLRVGDVPCIPAFTSYHEQCMQCGGSYASDCVIFDTLASCLFTHDMEQLFNIPKNIPINDLYDKMNLQHAEGGFSAAKSDLSWCDTSNGECIILNVNMYDTQNVRINMFNLQLRNASFLIEQGVASSESLADGTTMVQTDIYGGATYNTSTDKGTIDVPHCANSYSTSKQYEDAFVNNPPAPLYLNYYECTSGLWTIILNSSGVAGGNSALFGGTLLAAFMIAFTFMVDNFFPGIELPDDEEKVKIMKRLNHYPG